MNAKLALLLIYGLTALCLAGCGGGDDDGGGGAPAGTPEMDVERLAGVSIPDGGTDNLGTVAAGVPLPFRWTILNTGNANLLLSGSPYVAVSAQTNCAAWISTQPSPAVGVSSSTSFVVTLTVSSPAAFSFQLSIAGNDADENPYDFTVSGTGAAVPEIDIRRLPGVSIVQGGSDDVGSSFVTGVNPDVRWRIYNLGSATLNLTGTTPFVNVGTLVNCTVAVNAIPSNTIAAGGSTPFDLGINVTVPGAFSFSVSIPNDDPDEAPFSFVVQGSTPLTGPEIDVFTEFSGPIVAGSTIGPGFAPPGMEVHMLVAIRNSGNLPLNLGSVSLSGVANASVSIYKQPRTLVPPGWGTTLDLRLVLGESGTATLTVSIPSDDANENPFNFTIAAPILAHAGLLYDYTDGSSIAHLVHTTLSAGAETDLIPSYAAGSDGVYDYAATSQLAFFTADLASNNKPDLYYRGLPPGSPAAPQPLSTSLTGTTGSVVWFELHRNLLLFAAKGSSSGPAELYACAISGTNVASPVKISGSVAGGASGLVGTHQLSPGGRYVAFFGDMETAGVVEGFIVDLQGTFRTKFATPMVGNRVFSGELVWWWDDTVMLYLQEDSGGGTERELWQVNFNGLAASHTRISNVPPAGRLGVDPNQVSISSNGLFVYYRSREDVTVNRDELYLVSLVALSPAAPVGLNGFAIPGTAGVSEWAINHEGDRVLFEADSGTGGADELYLSSVSVSTFTTTLVVPSTLAGANGVDIAPEAFSAEYKAWFVQDDVVASRDELFYLDVSGTPAATRINAPGIFPGGASGVFGVLPLPDGRIMFGTDQGSAAAAMMGLCVANLSTTPAAIRLNSTTSTLAGAPTVLNSNLVGYVSNQTSATRGDLYAQNTTGGAPLRVSGSEVPNLGTVPGGAFLGSSRAIYLVEDAGSTIQELWTATTSGTPAQTRLSTAGRYVDGIAIPGFN